MAAPNDNQPNDGLDPFFDDFLNPVNDYAHPWFPANQMPNGPQFDDIFNGFNFQPHQPNAGDMLAPDQQNPFEFYNPAEFDLGGWIWDPNDYDFLLPPAPNVQPQIPAIEGPAETAPAPVDPDPEALLGPDENTQAHAPEDQAEVHVRVGTPPNQAAEEPAAPTEPLRAAPVQNKRKAPASEPKDPQEESFRGSKRPRRAHESPSSSPGAPPSPPIPTAPPAPQPNAPPAYAPPPNPPAPPAPQPNAPLAYAPPPNQYINEPITMNMQTFTPSLHKIREEMNEVRGVPAMYYDPSEQRRIVQRLITAMTSLDQAQDGPQYQTDEHGAFVQVKKATDQYTKFANGAVDFDDIEATCWNVLREVIQLHHRGSRLPIDKIPKTNRELGSDHDLQIAERINAIERTLQLWKLCWTSLFEGGHSLLAIVRGPRGTRNRKQSNRENNRIKATKLQRVAAEDAAQAQQAAPT